MKVRSRCLLHTLLGILLTLDNLDRADAYLFLPYWPLFLIVIVQDRENTVPATFAIAVRRAAAALHHYSGALLHLPLWPVVLILAGLAILARAFGFRSSAFAVESDSQ